MVQPVGNLIINMRMNVPEFSADLRKASARTAAETQRMRRSLDGTTASVERLRRAGHSRIIGPSFIAATRNFDSLSRRAEFLRATMISLTAVFGGLSTALVTNAVTSMADSYTNLNNQLKTVTRSEQERLLVEKALYAISQDSRTGLKENAVLFTRITRATDRFNLSLERRLNLTRTLQKGFISGGATPQEASSAAIQLTQGLAADQLGGEELRALKETPLGAFLAEGLGVNVGDLKELGAQGELTAERIVAAFEKVAPKIDELFDRTQMSIAQALTQLDNSFLLYIGSQDKSLGATQMLANGIDMLGQNIEEVTEAALVLTAALGTRWAGAAIGRNIESTTKSYSAYNKALQANVVNARAAQNQAQLLYRTATQNQKAALANAMAFQQGQRDATGYKNAMTALHKAHIDTSVASRNLKSSTVQLNQALTATTLRAKAATVAGRTLSRTMSFFGGPIGLAITGLSLGLLYVAQNSARANQRGQDYIDTLSATEREALGVASALEKASDEIKNLNSEAAKLAFAEKMREAEADAAIFKTELEAAVSLFRRFAKDAYGSGQIGREVWQEFSRATMEFRKSGEAGQDLSDAISKVGQEVEELGSDAQAINELIAKLLGATTAASNAAAAISGIGSALSGVDASINGPEGIFDLPTDYVEKRQKLERELTQAGLVGRDADIEKETSRVMSTYDIGEKLARKYATTLVDGKEKQRDFNRSLRQGGRDAEKLEEKLGELEQRAQVAFLEDLDRDAVRTAQSMRVAEADIQSFINSLRSGDLTSAPEVMLQIRDALGQIKTEEDARQVIDDTATATEKLKEKQEELARVVAAHPELAGRAKQAFVDYALSLDEFSWIDDATSAFGDFAKSAILDFNNIEDAAKSFLNRLAEIALEVLVIEPLVSNLRNSLAGGFGGGGGLFGGIGSILSAVFHEGGDADSPKRHRSVPASAFIGAPRFHSGVGHDELAAVIKKNEAVLTENQMAATIGTINGLSRQANNPGQLTRIEVIPSDLFETVVTEKANEAGVTAYRAAMADTNKSFDAMARRSQVNRG